MMVFNLIIMGYFGHISLRNNNWTTAPTELIAFYEKTKPIHEIDMATTTQDFQVVYIPMNETKYVNLVPQSDPKLLYISVDDPTISIKYFSTYNLYDPVFNKTDYTA